MIIISIKRNHLNAFIAAIFIFLLGFSFYKYMMGMKERNYHQMVPTQSINELERASAETFLASSNVHDNIEIFDIGKGSVIKVIQINDFALTEASKYLQGITGMYAKVRALPDKGYIVKIPFEYNIIVKNKWLNDYNINSVDKIFIIFPQDRVPYLLVLDEKERPYFYCFNGDTNKLLKSLNFEPDNLQ